MRLTRVVKVFSMETSTVEKLGGPRVYSSIVHVQHVQHVKPILWLYSMYCDCTPFTVGVQHALWLYCGGAPQSVIVQHIL